MFITVIIVALYKFSSLNFTFQQDNKQIHES